jgi:hypothetical protein
MNLHDAIRTLHPNVITINGEDAFDVDGNQITYDKQSALSLVEQNAYKAKRAAEYPDFRDYLDGIVKGDQEQINAYIAACNAVKNKYPKG